jgi:CRP-like cAMP-binding protein
VDQLLASLDQEATAALRAIGTVRRFRVGQVLFHEGDPSNHVVLITAGEVKVSSAHEAGGETVLAIRRAGDLIGELSAIDDRPRSATATAITPVDAVVVPAPAFGAFLTQHPGAAVALLRTVIARLRDADAQRVEFGSHQSLPRLARRLLQLAESYGRPAPDGTIHIELPVTQEELAGWVGASRESVARALRALRSTGAVTTARRAITVVDLDRLRELAR